MIVVTHFNNPYLEPMRFFVNRPFGIYIGGLGVSLFLIISGAALMYNYGDRESLDLRTFYTKRAKTLYPMFWVAFIVANILLFIRNNGYIFVPRHKITAIFFAFWNGWLCFCIRRRYFLCSRRMVLRVHNTVLHSVSTFKSWRK
ncbi:hypothetical protein HMPREF0421_20410 [Gardnerella vaginalis ATCC 14019]|uniref:Acyltransferase 3 domain-containing protein n=1 Tax=Gardnerella vaginalis (strain ATCC 14019 / 317) TaxID=525284 RepID=E3D8U8_GARV3|nr:hypothetical protein HMPREF0421_20410 [Gardnerella vaginalis ATCC 14019]